MSARYPFEIRLQFPLWCLPSLSERAMRQEQSVCPTQAVPCLERPHATPQRTHNARPMDPQDSTRSFSLLLRPEFSGDMRTHSRTESPALQPRRAIKSQFKDGGSVSQASKQAQSRIQAVGYASRITGRICHRKASKPTNSNG
ncbi:hypothetical protein E4U23_001328 [Claviceps purpurea]|nr:hypothetical protein E4U23_001328 [Claviceps purpurea]